MKFNKWTLGLAAVGVVSLASVAQAEEKALLAATTISGYVDTSAQWNVGTGNANLPRYKFGGAGKADGFNLNVVQISIAKPLDESQWAAGYKVDLWFGPDAKTLGTDSYIGLLNVASDFAIRQAYVALRAPVGNGLDFKMGVFDSIIGYESVESGNNPNYTRSYGHSIEPQTHTGVLATYRFSDVISASVGVANTIGPSINARAFPSPIGLNIAGVSIPSFELPLGGDRAESYKTYMGSVALTAPESFGWAAGSTLYGGVVNGFNGPGAVTGVTQTSWYVGGTLATPVTGLKFGAAFDYMNVDHSLDKDMPDIWTAGAYASYQATEKLSLHARGEYLQAQPGDGGTKLTALTGTVQYDLWKNVISRLEVRWDHSANGCKQFGGTPSAIDIEDGIGGILDSFQTDPTRKNAFMVALNVIYKF